MNWYIIVRRTIDRKNRNRLLCWRYVDGICATTHDVALEKAMKRNWWKPDQIIVTQRCYHVGQDEVAESLNKSRTKDIEKFDSLMRRKVTQ